MGKSFSTHSIGEKITPSANSPSLTANLVCKVTRFDRWIAQKLLANVGAPPVALVLWDRTIISPAKIKPRAHVIISNRPTLLCLLINPEHYFGELYSTGRIEVEGDLLGFLRIIYRSVYYSKRALIPRLLFTKVRSLIAGNNSTTARKNIHHHYDIGNAFYEKWLDKDLQYTCAYYANPDDTLEQAQIAKMSHICRKLMLKPGQTVVEAGCGWGGLAMFMAREYGVNVKAYNISHEQIAYARQRIKNTHLQGQVEYIEDDYRNIKGEYDAFVSVGMLEHVGIENYAELGKIINACLKLTGIGLIHTIGRNRPDYLNTWIVNRIFPGACPPSISQIMEIFEPQSFSVLDIENLRLHYVKTLEQWLSRFNTNVNLIRLEYDEEFIRTWRLYLSGSVTAFMTGTLQLFQVLFTRAQNNALPWSRSHLYN